MAFDCGFSGTSFNGIENDDISVQLTGMSKADLEKLLNDAESIKTMAKNGNQVKKSIQDKETLMQQNRQLAEKNLAMEPEFLVKKQELANVYKQLADAKTRYTNLKSQIDALSSNYSPSTILALIQAANAESEERSDELANQFINGDMNVDQFLRDFLPLRKLCNERRFKSEKLTESLSGSRPVVPTRPTLLTPTPLREAPRPSQPATQSAAVPTALYPDLSRTNSFTNSQSNYGFKG